LQALLAVPGIAELLDGLAVYTQNHFARLGRLQRSAYLLDYTLASMNTLLPPGGEHSGAAAASDAAGASPSKSGPNGHLASAPLEAGQDGATPAAAALEGQPSSAAPLQLEGSIDTAVEDAHAARTTVAGAAETGTMSNGVEGMAADGDPTPDGTAGTTPAHTAQEADTQQTGTGKRKRAAAKSKRRSADGIPQSNGVSKTGSKGKKAKQIRT
jgi:Utp13 specific WD40 associated domain